jgi:hypothetical protein
MLSEIETANNAAPEIYQTKKCQIIDNFCQTAYAI